MLNLHTVEPTYSRRIVSGNFFIEPGIGPKQPFAREKYLLWRATGLAIESATLLGVDLPVGAATSKGTSVTGAYFASDQRTGYGPMHAEERALVYGNLRGEAPDLLGVTIEPCEKNCQPIISSYRSIKTVAFVLDREDVSSKGLIKPHPGILDKIESGDIQLPYDVIQITEPRLTKANHIILDNVSRDTESGATSIDLTRLEGQLAELPGFSRFR